MEAGIATSTATIVVNHCGIWRNINVHSFAAISLEETDFLLVQDVSIALTSYYDFGIYF